MASRSTAPTPTIPLAKLHLGTGNPSQCRFPDCSVPISTDFKCKECSESPSPSFIGNRLADIRYCSSEHQTQDLKGHKTVCEHRRWLRDAERIGSVCSKTVLVALKEMSNLVLVDCEETETGKKKLFFRACAKSVDEEPVLSVGVDAETAKCALSIRQCVESLKMATLLLAFLIKDLPIRVQEMQANSPIVNTSTRAFLEVTDRNGQEVRMTAMQHEKCSHVFFRLTPGFFSPPADRLNEDGMVMDPSFAQFGYKRALDNWKFYLEKKINAEKGVLCRPFGYQYRRYTSGLDKGYDPSSGRDLLKITTINNFFYEIINKTGGVTKLLSMSKEEFEQWEGNAMDLLSVEMAKLRSSCDRNEATENVTGNEGHEVFIQAFESVFDNLRQFL